jgi:hypothetical protein
MRQIYPGIQIQGWKERERERKRERERERATRAFIEGKVIFLTRDSVRRREENLAVNLFYRSLSECITPDLANWSSLSLSLSLFLSLSFSFSYISLCLRYLSLAQFYFFHPLLYFRAKTSSS